MRRWEIAAVAGILVSALALAACGLVPCRGDDRNIDLDIFDGPYVEDAEHDVLADESVEVSAEEVVITYVGDDGVEYRAVYEVESSDYRE